MALYLSDNNSMKAQFRLKPSVNVFDVILRNQSRLAVETTLEPTGFSRGTHWRRSDISEQLLNWDIITYHLWLSYLARKIIRNRFLRHRHNVFGLCGNWLAYSVRANWGWPSSVATVADSCNSLYCTSWAEKCWDWHSLAMIASNY